MVQLIGQGGKTSYKIESHIADTLEDMKNLPTDLNDCGMGSTCFIIETAQLFVLNSKGEWIEIK